MATFVLYTSFKLHMTIALTLSIWLVALLVLLAPFDASDLSFRIRLIILPPYGLISFIGYMTLIPIQNQLFKRHNTWNLFLEALVILIFNVLVLFGSFAYYKTNIINGTYSFFKFTFEVYYPIFFILLPVIIIGRWYMTKRFSNKVKDRITLVGENKYDILRIEFSDLICVSSADNYVEVSYLQKWRTSKKAFEKYIKKYTPTARRFG